MSYYDIILTFYFKVQDYNLFLNVQPQESLNKLNTVYELTIIFGN